MNLDNKVLVDKDDLREAIQYVREVSIERSDWSLLYFAETLESALAQDNTGYVRVPVEPTREMLDASAGELPEYRPDDPEWDELEYEIVRAERHQDAAAYRAMIAAAQEGE